MKKQRFIIILIAAWACILFMLTSCKPSLETCNRLYPPQIKDSVSIIQKLDTAYILISGDTTNLRTPIPCQDFTASTVNNKKEVKVVIKNHYLTVDCITKNDSLKIVKAVEHQYKGNTKIVKEIVYKNVTPKLAWISYILNTIFILWGTFWLYLKFKN